MEIAKKNNLNHKADVVIAGGGLAGLVTALELLETGKKVVIFDRDTSSKIGGLARESFGGINIVGTPLQKRGGHPDHPDLAYQDWCDAAEFGPQDQLPKEWARAYVERSKNDLYDWLRQNGVKFFPVVHWVERGLERRGNSVPRFHMVWGTGKGLVETLLGRIERHPNRDHLQFFFEHEVKGIEQKAGTFSGFFGVNHQNGESFYAQGEALVIASGGIGGNVSQIRQHWDQTLGPPPSELLNGSHPYADGQLWEVIKTLGGNITHLDKHWLYAAGVHHPKPSHVNHGLSLIPPKSALWVNAKGRRIGPRPLVTGFDTRFLVSQICQQTRGYSWQILNWKMALKELAVSGSEYNPSIRDRKLFAFLWTVLFGNKLLVKDLTQNCRDFVIGNSLEELADKMNQLNEDQSINPQVLKEEVKAYDFKMVEIKKTGQSDDEQLQQIALMRKYRGDRVRICNFQRILDPKAFPLIAIREFILTRKSLGGIQTDLKSRVLDSKGQILPSLYAVGEAAGFGGGGIHGLRSLEGTFLGACILTAQSAAQSISHSI